MGYFNGKFNISILHFLPLNPRFVSVCYFLPQVMGAATVPQQGRVRNVGCTATITIVIVGNFENVRGSK